MDRKKNTIIKYSNKLNKVPLLNFSKAELDFFYAVCSKVRDRGTDVITIKYAELAELTNYYGKDHPKSYDEIFDTFSDKVLSTRWEYITGDGWKEKANLFRKFATNESEAALRVQVDEDFLFVFNDIAKEFTRFELEEYVSLSSKYSKQLYRQLKQWRTQGFSKEYSVKEIKELLDTPPDYTPKRILEKVINPAMNDINGKGAFKNLWCDVIREPHAKGRPVRGYVFHFGKEEIPGQMSARTPSEWNEIAEASKKKKKKNSFNNFNQREYSDRYYEVLDKFMMGENLSEEEKEILNQGELSSNKT